MQLATTHHLLQPSPLSGPSRDSNIQQAAQDFEAVFLAEMLRAAGAGTSAQVFGGGIGEDQFSSFLVDAQAREISRAGGIGIAEMLLRGLVSYDESRM